MKKIYLLVLSFIIGGSSVAQTNINETTLYKKEKFALTKAKKAPSVEIKSTPIWTEDFANGIPSTWSNVTVNGPVDWKYTTVGHTGSYPTAAILSTTASNGWVVVDSDGDNFNGGGVEQAELTTGVIDCSGYSNLKLEFQQMFREWQNDITTVRVTNDGGANWTDFVINDGIGQSGTPNPDVVTLNISAVADNQANVQIQFKWEGAWDYGWQIDDISISETPVNDLKISNSTYDNDIEYTVFPATQLQPLEFASVVVNQGQMDQTNVTLNVDVNDGSSSVFSASSNAIATVSAWSVPDSLTITAPFTPSTAGNYTINYAVNQNETDNDLSNNLLTRTFEVSSNEVYARDLGNGGRLSNGNTNGNYNAYEYGNLFEAINAGSAYSLSVWIDDSTFVNALAYAALYEIDASGNFAFIDGSGDYSITADDIPGWIHIDYNSPVTMNAGTDYIAVVGTYGGPEGLFIGRGENSSPDQTAFILNGTDNTWYFTTRSPKVRLNLSNWTTVDELEKNEVKLSQNIPNPFNGTTTVNYELTNASNVEFVVYDVTGKQIEAINYGKRNAGAHAITLDLNGLNAGIYYYTMNTDGGSVTKKMIVW